MSELPESSTGGADDELQRLRRENAELRAEAADSAAVATSRHIGRRRVVASLVLLVLGTAMLPTAVVTVWTRNQVLDTDRYVQTITPLADDPIIEATVANRIAQAVSTQIDVKSLAQEALPPEAAFLAAPIAAGADNLIQETSKRIVRSDQFKTVWVEANRVGHKGLVVALTGTKGDVLSTTDGKVVLNLGDLAETVLAETDKEFGLDLSSKIPADKLNATFVLVDSAQLADVQAGVRWLDRLSWLSVILAVGMLAGSIALRPDRRRATLLVGGGIALSMLVLYLGFALGRDVLLTNLPSGVERPDAIAAFYDILTRLIQQAIRVLFVVGLVVLTGAWLAGPSRAAAKVRGAWDKVLGRTSGAAGSVVDLGPVPAWFARHTSTLRVVVLAAAVLALLTWTQPTGKVVLMLALVALVAIGLIQFLAGMGRPPRPNGGATDGDGADGDVADGDVVGGDAGDAETAEGESVSGRG